MAWASFPGVPLAGGKLTGKYQRGEPAPPNSREDPAKFSEQTWSVLEGWKRSAKTRAAP